MHPLKSLPIFSHWLKLATFLASILSAAAANLYVAPTGSGSDKLTSGTLSSPFATLAYAAGKAAPGDTILLMPGSYFNANYNNPILDVWKTEETIRIANLNGNAQNPITIKPQIPNTVTLYGDGTNIFQLRNSSYVKIEDLHIEGKVNQIPLSLALEYQFQYKDENNVIQYRINPPGQPPLTTAEIEAINNLPAPLATAIRPSYFSTVGLLIQSCHHIEVNRCTIHHTPGVGLRFQGCDNFKAQYNTIHNCSRRSSIGNHGFVVHSLNNDVATPADTSPGTHVEIIGNRVYDNYNEVYSWSELKSFITPVIDEGKGISMQKNTIANGWKAGRVLIANNCCWNNGFSGIHLNEGLRMDIIHNTCYNNQFSGKGPNTGISLQTTSDVTICNNISVALNSFNGQAINVGDSTNLTISNNLVQGSVSPEVSAIQTNTTFANPLWVNPSSQNFHLQSTSPAIGLANPSFTTATDIDLQPRSAPADLGAFEFIPNALHLWRNQYFQSYHNAQLAANTVDANQNGNSNLIDFAFGINPASSSTLALTYNPATQAILTTGNPTLSRSSNAIQLSYIQRKDADSLGLQYTILASTDLISWSPITPTTSAIAASNDTYQVVTATLPTTPIIRFYRLSVTLPEPN